MYNSFASLGDPSAARFAPLTHEGVAAPCPDLSSLGSHPAQNIASGEPTSTTMGEVNGDASR